MNFKPLVIAASAAVLLPAAAQTQLTVVNFGGANANAQKKAFYEPIEKNGIKVVPVEYNGEHCKIRSQLPDGTVTIAMGTHLLEDNMSVEAIEQ